MKLAVKSIACFIIILSITISYATNSNATQYIVWDTEISVYAQSASESTAHLIAISKGMYNDGEHPWCGNRAYILFSDKELFATALAASLSGKRVNVRYEDAAETKIAAGHIEFTCKVISIWW